MPSVQITKYDAQDIFKLSPPPRDQQLTIDDHPVGIRKQCAHEEAEEPEPEPKVRTVTVLRLTEGLGLTGAVIRVSEDADWNEERAAATEGACLLAVRRLWRGRRGLCVARLQSSSGTCALPPVLLGSGDGDPLGRSAVQGAVPVFALPVISYFCKFFVSTHVSFVLVKIRPSQVWIHPLSFNFAFVGKICLDLNLVKLSCLGTSFDVTSGNDNNS